MQFDSENLYSNEEQNNFNNQLIISEENSLDLNDSSDEINVKNQNNDYFSLNCNYVNNENNNFYLKEDGEN